MINDILLKAEQKMEGALNLLSKELSSIRTGRATPSLVEHIKVDYNGVPMPINQLASISVPGARYLVIQPWDRSCIHSIEKAILKSDLGLTPSNDGTVIRLNVPPLSDERRDELVKMVHKRVEESKVIIRNHRRDAMDNLKKIQKASEISEDEMKRASDQLQKLTDTFTGSATEDGQAKENELKEV